MKLRHFFFAAMLIGGFAACSDEENLGGVDNGSSEVNAYMTLQIVGPQGMGTKTDGDPSGTTDPADPESGDYLTGVANEGTIKSVMVILSQNGSVTKTLNISSGLETLNGITSTPRIPVSEGIYEVYVIANPPANFSVSEGVTAKVISNVLESSMQTQYADVSNGTFMMFNECNGSEVTSIAGESIKVTSANDYENPAKTAAPIQLDRLAVKINSSAASQVTITNLSKEFSAIAKVDLQGFKLLNGASEVNLQQKWEYGIASTYPWCNILQTPSMVNAAEDGDNNKGYYNHLSQFRVIEYGTTVGDVTSYNYTTAQDTYDHVPYYGGDNAKTASIYCMENNSSDLNGTTTGLVYQWKVTLNENASDNIAGTNCFYSYDGKFYGKLADIETAYPGIFNVAEQQTGEDTKLAAAERELGDAYKVSTGYANQQKAISNFRAKYKIKVYTEGIMYYTYFIKDQNYISNAGDVNSHYYSVMRNTIYDLKVTALNGIGTDIPGGWNPDVDPEDPVDPTNVYMVVQATVNLWVVSSEDITLD